ncbi:MAG: YncE family protein [Erythrobacter sp.]
MVTDARMPTLGSEGYLFVANKRGNTLSKIDLGTGREVKRVPVCKNPHELTLIEQDILVAVACYGGQTIEAFRAKDLQLIQRVQLGKNARPHGIVWREKDGAIFVTAEGRQSIMRVDGALSRSPKVTEFKTDQDGSHMIAVAPDASAAWTTNLGTKTVTWIDLSGDRPLPLHVTIGLEPEGIALSPDGGTLWVSARRSDKAYALDPETLAIRAELDTGRFPLRLAIRPQGDFAVTSNLADGSLTVIDLGEGEVVRQIAVSSAAEAEARQQVTILWSNDGTRIYVAETGTDTVAEVDFASGKVLRRLKTGKGGDGMAILD